MIDYRVYLVTDNPSRYRRDWLETIEAALDGGVTCVQYRDTENPAQTQYARIVRLQDLLRPRHIPLIVNNDPELATAVKAEGVHVGQGDMPPEQVRSIVGPRCEIGLSITCSADLSASSLIPRPQSTVDCIGIGPVYDARKTKADASAAIGPEGVREIVSLVPEIPNCAIGGITVENAAETLSAGAKGLAIVSALSQSEDPYETARHFRLLFDRRRV